MNSGIFKNINGIFRSFQQKKIENPLKFADLGLNVVEYSIVAE